MSSAYVVGRKVDHSAGFLEDGTGIRHRVPGSTMSGRSVPASHYSQDAASRNHEKLLDKAIREWGADRKTFDIEKNGWLQERTSLHDCLVDLRNQYDRLSQELEAWRTAYASKERELMELQRQNQSDAEKNAYHDVIQALTQERDAWKREALKSRQDIAQLSKVDHARDTVIKDQANFREERDIALAKMAEVKHLMLVALTSAPTNMSEQKRRIRKTMFDELWPQIVLEQL